MHSCWELMILKALSRPEDGMSQFLSVSSGSYVFLPLFPPCSLSHGGDGTDTLFRVYHPTIIYSQYLEESRVCVLPCSLGR